MSAPFAQISQGPFNPTGKNTNPQSIVLDRQNNIVSSVGDAEMEAALQSALFVVQAQTALTTITTAQNLFSKALNPGALNKVNRTILISGSVIYTSPGTTAPVLSFAVVLGGVTLCTITMGAISTTASTNMPINFWFELQTITTGTTATLETHGQVNANISANTPAAAVTTYNDTNTAVSSAVNLVSAATLSVTIASTLTLTSMQLRQMTIEVLN